MEMKWNPIIDGDLNGIPRDEELLFVKQLQEKVKAEKPENHTPLRNHEWFL